MNRAALGALFVACWLWGNAQAQPVAETVYRGGEIWMGDPFRRWATALAVRQGRLVAVGGEHEVSPWIGPETEVVDLEGAMVVPGFCDSHTHPVTSGLELGQLVLGEVQTAEALEQAIRDYARAHPERPWIVGGGWSLPLFPTGGPTRHDLDRLIPDRPVFLTTSDAHTAWVNSRALAVAGLDARSVDPPGGRIERDAAGFPNGLLRESAIALVASHLPTESRESYREGARQGLRLAAQYGITTLHEANATPEVLQAYADLEEEGALTSRVVAALSTDPALGLEQVATLRQQRQRWGRPRLQPRAVKLFVDGVLESGTAALLDPYRPPGHDHGILNWSASDLAAIVAELEAEGFQIHLHTIGDAAVRQALDAFEQSAKQRGRWGDLRHHLAHLQLIAPSDLARFRRLGVIANLQPLWACRDAFIRDLTEPVLGEERSARLYPFGDLHRAGALLVAGSDWSVSSMNPLLGIEVALTRREPDQGEGPAWLPEQRLDLPTLLSAYTLHGAYLSFSEHETGSLEVGKWADFVVLEKNLFDLPSHEVGEVRVLRTVVEGRTVFAAEER